ncbi:MAG TPA: class I SAM-dependent methyltransferase [Beijerinckiaceae bacterium]|nr:class I SAM-dependent methyltransferase [Beijerinckiaceae bacterium]
MPYPHSARPLAAALFAGALMLAPSAFAQDAEVKLDVPYVPTPMQVVDKMLELAQVTKDDYVIDLGSGDGRIPIRAAEKYGARAFGVDINPVRVKEAEENKAKANVGDRVSFKVQNLFDTPIGEANVLTMYLLSRVNLELRPRILKEMRPGSRVTSHAFDMGDWKPERHEKVDGRDVYLWIVPAQVEGKWTIKDGDRSITVDLKQRYQELEGTATVGGQSGKVRDGRLRGTEISFVVDVDGKPRRFTGQVDGNQMKAGEAKQLEVPARDVEAAKDWQASRAS